MIPRSRAARSTPARAARRAWGASGRVRLGLLAAAVALGAAPAEGSAQRSARPTWVAPVEVALVAWPGPAAAARPHRYVLVLTASADVEVLADRRLAGLEITVPGRRRPHRCAMPDRPRRLDASLARTLRRGERWAEWLDLRELCWGRALAALFAGAPGTSARVTYGVGRGARAWVARVTGDGGGTARSLAAADVVLPPAGLGAEETPPADVRVTLAPADARRGPPPLRVAVYGGAGTRRAWLRPDRFRFRVVDPAGETWVCRLPRTGGAPVPDLFARLGPRRPARFSLDSGAYCPASVFGAAGVYEVTPILELDEDGAAWGMRAVVGTFTGEPAPVRVRGAAADRSVEAAVLREILR